MAAKRRLPVTHRALTMAACLAAGPALSQTAPQTIIYTFRGRADGANPAGPLLKVGGKFYGTTESGGSHFNGTVFSVGRNGAHKVLYKFKGGADGSFPAAGLVELAGVLYGTTYSGGGGKCGSGCGTVYSMTPKGVYKQLYAFQNGADGENPAAPLTVLNGVLYGSASEGGPNNAGSVFSVTPQGVETTLHSFQGNTDGQYPTGLITDGTTLYGATFTGAGTGCLGTGCGTVFTINPQGNFATLYSFGNGSYGWVNQRLLLLGNELYGTTTEASAVFSLSLTGTFKILHVFSQTDGDYPSGLTALHGTLYGTTAAQAQYSHGALFSITTDGSYATLYDFMGGIDGSQPGNLLAVGNTLYGTTRGGDGKGNDCAVGGEQFCGTVFSITP